MSEMYEQSEVIDIVLDVVKWANRHDEQFDFGKSEEFVLPISVEDKAERVCANYGRQVDDVKNDVNLSSRGLVIESELDDEYVVSVLEYLEESNLSEKEAIGGLRLQANSSGGRPSKVEKWRDRIEDGPATLEDARGDMSDPTWYKLRDQVE